jgi:MFS family permease
MTTEQLAPPAPERLGLDFWKFWAGQTISNLGSSFTFFALPLLVYELTGSAINLALTTASEFVPYLLFGLIIGAWTDRLDRKKLMILVDLLRALSITTIPLLSLAGVLRVEWIYAVGFINSTLNIFFDASQYAAIPNLVDKDDLVTANGRIQASFSGAQIVGPALAGALVAILAIEDVLYFDALTFLVSALSLGAIRSSFNPTEQPVERKSIRKDVAEGLRYVLQHPLLRNISLMMAIYNLIGATVFTQLVLFADVRLDADASHTALLFSAGAAGIAVLGLLAGRIRKRWSFSKVALTALLLDGLLTLLFSQLREFWIALVVYGLAGGLGILFNIQTISLRQAIVPNNMLGRIMSIAGVLAWSAIPVGAYLGGLLIEATHDVALVYSGIGVLLIIIPIVFAFGPLGHAESYLPEDEAREEGAHDPERVPAGP